MALWTSSLPVTGPRVLWGVDSVDLQMLYSWFQIEGDFCQKLANQNSIQVDADILHDGKAKPSPNLAEFASFVSSYGSYG